MRLCGKLVEHRLVSRARGKQARDKARRLWTQRYPGEPYDFDPNRPPGLQATNLQTLQANSLIMANGSNTNFTPNHSYTYCNSGAALSVSGGPDSWTTGEAGGTRTTILEQASRLSTDVLRIAVEHTCFYYQ
ncbi:unnamed protein product, partial [Protopolystoma xenopodis]